MKNGWNQLRINKKTGNYEPPFVKGGWGDLDFNGRINYSPEVSILAIPVML